TPNKDYSGTPTPVTVQAKDDNGTPATATYSPVVKPAVPTADNQKTTDVQGAKQTVTPVFTPGKNTVNNQETEVPFEPTSKAKLIDPSKTGEEAEVTSLEVPNQGTYTIDDNGVVTFTPLPTFTGEATPVSIVRKDKNGTPATATYTPKVVGVTPTSENAKSEGIQGATQEGTPVFTAGKANVGTEENPVEKTVPLTISATNPAKFVVDGQPVEETTIPAKEGDKEVGTYTIEPATGKVTFTPNKDYSGTPTPVTVQAKDDNGTPVTATYSPTVTPVTPEGTPAETTGIQGIKQEGTPTFKPGNPNVPIDEEVAPTLEGANPEGKVVVPGEGTYTVDKDGKVTFTPEPQFSGVAKGVTVKRVDKNGTPVTAKYTPTVTPVTPEGTPVETTGLQGIKQEGTPTFKPGNPNVPIDEEVAPTLEGANPEGKLVVPGEGTYTVDKDGKVTFTPELQFTGTAKGVTVKRVDKNGTPVTAKYTPTVTPVTPTGENAETEGPKAQPQTSTIVFDKKDEDTTTVNFNKGHESVALDPTTTTLVGKDGSPATEVKVPGEGTYTLANNVITFTPEQDFAGKATGVTVQVKDANGTVVTKTYTPTVRPVTTFVDGSGNPITVDKNNTPVVPEEDGTQPKKDIYGYKLVRTETDNKGNTKHIYEPAKGETVKVTYVSTTGDVLKDSQTVQPKDTLVSTDYDASTENLKPERIEKDGKVYLLKERKADSASETGKVSDKEQTITYVYEEVKEPETKQNFGSVVVVYRDKYGRPISGITDTGKTVGSSVVDTPNTPLNTKYDTTDNRPQTITTKDGKVYVLKKVTNNSDAEKSGVKGRTSVVTYVYEMLNNTEELPEAHIGLVLVNYQDEEGNPISGKTPEGKAIANVVVDTDATLVDTEYDTTDNKPSVIIAENGDVYELVKASDTSVEKGKVVEGATIVDYVYRKVETKFVDENGKEIKSSEKGTKSKEEISGYVFKETKKDEKGNTIHVYTKKSSSTALIPNTENGQTTIWKDVDGNIIKTQENGKKEHSTINGYVYDHSEEDKDGNITHIYRKVNSTTSEVNEKETSYVDENGKTVQATKQGQHPQDNIPGYEFVRTETDANGNVRHVYRQVAQSPATVNTPETVEQRKNELPNTGTGDEFAIFGAAAASILAGLGIAISGKKKEEEK
ncbi:MucBP domain-containing protein, partial [Granulicatella sp.]